jgi:hypothetical protein
MDMWLDITNSKHHEDCQLLDAGLKEVTAKKWQDAIHHIIQEEQRMWKIWSY